MDWIFQCNPKRYDLAMRLERGDTCDFWAMNQGKKLVSPGDRVFFWQTGTTAQLLATGEIVSRAYERSDSEFGRYFVDVVLQHRVVPALTRQEALANEALSNLAPFRGMQGTNYALRDPTIVAELEKTIVNRLVPIPRSRGLEAYQHKEIGNYDGGPNSAVTVEQTLQAIEVVRRFVAQATRLSDQQEGGRSGPWALPPSGFCICPPCRPDLKSRESL